MSKSYAFQIVEDYNPRRNQIDIDFIRLLADRVKQLPEKGAIIINKADIEKAGIVPGVGAGKTILEALRQLLSEEFYTRIKATTRTHEKQLTAVVVYFKA